MDILKIASEWAKNEVLFLKLFILFGIVFVIATVGFWQLGKTEMAKAFIIPTLVAGTLLLILGFGLVYSNTSKLKSFPTEYKSDATAFLKSEITRAEETIAGYNNAVFKVMPIIILASALLLIFIDKPIWRAISITTIAMMIVIILVDSNAIARLEAYKNQLELVDK